MHAAVRNAPSEVGSWRAGRQRRCTKRIHTTHAASGVAAHPSAKLSVSSKLQGVLMQGSPFWPVLARDLRPLLQGGELSAAALRAWLAVAAVSSASAGEAVSAA